MSLKARALRDLLARPEMVIAPGAYDAISAMMIEQAGFPAVYMTGSGTAASLGFPDFGLTTMTEMVENAAVIARSVSLPVISDADTGYGNELNVTRTVREFEARNVAAIHIEDQVAPKRCGHFSGKEVISTKEAVSKIKAAVDARQDADLLIMARTDAAATHGFEAAIERAQRFAEAGADILFVEAVTQAEEVRALPTRLAQPQLMNMVIGGKTPIFNAEQLGEMGYGIVLYANAALQGAVAGMQKALTVLRDEKEVQESSGLVTPFAERQRLVGKPEWDALERQYV